MRNVSEIEGRITTREKEKWGKNKRQRKCRREGKRRKRKWEIGSKEREILIKKGIVDEGRKKRKESN